MLNVRDGPAGLPIGLLANGMQVVIREYVGNWVHMVVPADGWIFRPLLACQPPPPPVAVPEREFPIK
jgi:hypothetical protein